MAKEHVLKCWPQYFEAIVFDQKTFEVRYNDRGYERGDILILREYNNDTKEYTRRQTRVEVTNVFNEFGLQPGWVIMSLKKCKCCRSLF